MAASSGLSRAIFRAMAPGLLDLGMSANAIIREARVVGTSYRRQNMLADINEMLGRKTKQFFVRQVKRNAFPTPYSMVETELARARKYLIQGVAKYSDTLTGKTIIKETSMYSDLNLSPAQMESTFADWKEESQYRIDLELISFEPTFIGHNKGWSY